MPEKIEKIEDFSTCATLKHFQGTSQKSKTMEIHIQPLVQTKNKFMLNERMWQIIIVKHFARDPLVSLCCCARYECMVSRATFALENETMCYSVKTIFSSSFFFSLQVEPPCPKFLYQ